MAAAQSASNARDDVGRPALEDQLDALQNDLLCPVTLQPYEDPVFAGDGRVYERAAIEEIAARARIDRRALRSPTTNEVMPDTELRPADAKRQAVAEWKARMYRAHATKSVAADDLPALHDLKPMEPEVFASLDAFLHSPLFDDLPLRTPCLIPLGEESCGKSTVLERVVGFPLLPRAMGLCTRMCIRIRLRRSRAVAEPIRLVVCDRTAAGPQEVDGTVEWIPAAEMIVGAVKRIMDAQCAELAAGQCIVHERELLVEVRRPALPNLDILDVPGLVTVNNSQFPRKSDEARALLRDVIAHEKDNAMFLVLAPVKLSMNANAIFELVLDHDFIRERALGVLTCVDDFNGDRAEGKSPAECLTELLSGASDALPALKHGWCAAASPPPSRKTLEAVEEAHRERFRLLSIDINERTHLNDLAQQHPSITPLIGDRVGLAAVRSLIQGTYERFIAAHWVPRIRPALLSRAKDDLADLERMGLPLPQDAAYAQPLRTLDRLWASAKLAAFAGDGAVRAFSNIRHAVGHDVIGGLIGVRARDVDRHTSADWSEVNTSQVVADSMRAVEDLVNRSNVETSGRVLALPAAAWQEASLRQELKSMLETLVRALVQLADGGELAARYAKAVFGIDDAPGTTTDAAEQPRKACGPPESWVAVFETLSFDEQQRLTVLERFNEARAEFSNAVQRLLVRRLPQFSDFAESFIRDSLATCVVAEHRAAGALVAVSSEAKQKVLQLAGNFFFLVAGRITHDLVFDLPQRAILESDDVRCGRKLRLASLTAVFTALDALQTLVHTVERRVRSVHHRGDRSAAAAAAATAALPRPQVEHFVLVLDASQSMQGSRWAEVCAATQPLLAALAERGWDAILTVVLFGAKGEAQVAFSGFAATLSDPSFLSGITPSMGIEFFEGFDKAANALQTAQRNLAVARAVHIAFIADGGDTNADPSRPIADPIHRLQTAIGPSDLERVLLMKHGFADADVSFDTAAGLFRRGGAEPRLAAVLDPTTLRTELEWFFLAR